MQATTTMSTNVKLCATCKQVKPLKDYITKSTNAQAQAWGYKKAIDYESKNCKSCRKPPRPLSKLTLKEIQNKIASGDIHGFAIGQLMKEKRIAQGRIGIKQGLIDRWKDRRASLWAGLLVSSDKEWERVRSYTYKLLPDTNTKHSPELLAFYTAYTKQIRQVRTHFSTQKKLGTITPKKHLAWWQYISEPQRKKLIEQWESIPFTQRQHMNKPAIINDQGE